MSSWLNCTKTHLNSFAGPLRIGKSKFAVIPSRDNRILIFDIITATWSNIRFEPDLIKFSYADASFDESKNIIYLVGRKYHYQNYETYQTYNILAINLMTHTMQQLLEHKTDASYQTITHSTDHIHIIDDSNHYIFNLTTKHLHTQDTRFFRYIPGLSVVNMRSRKSLLLFNNKLSSFYEFCLSNLNWVKWKMDEQPDHLTETSVITSQNEEFIIFLGGLYKDDKFGSELDDKSNKIHIFNMKTQQITESRIKCPLPFLLIPTQRVLFQAVMMYDVTREKLLVYGYTRKSFEAKQFEHIPKLPDYLINQLKQYITIEDVHLFALQSGGATQNHWKINLDLILQ
ncbi:MAG: hypothetical protein GY938_02590 [Ketobacter sp.]|nr:hypothetical protein [Ketobacter sp.]